MKVRRGRTGEESEERIGIVERPRERRSQDIFAGVSGGGRMGRERYFDGRGGGFLRALCLPFKC